MLCYVMLSITEMFDDSHIMANHNHVLNPYLPERFAVHTKNYSAQQRTYNGGAEKAEVENAAVDSTGEECRSGKNRSSLHISGGKKQER